MHSIQSKVFLSERDPDPRFVDHEKIQGQLERLCTNWVSYLEHHVNRTNHLFGIPEHPWKRNERVFVSTLAASIARANKEAIVSEELPVPKQSSIDEMGRCDLWAHIPGEGSGESFNFYLEAKKFRRDRQPEEIESALTGPYGIRRMFSDYAKSRDGKIDQRSPYSKMRERQHPHYVIGMIGLPIVGKEISADEVKTVFDAFSRKQYVNEDKERRLGRYPTAGFYINDTATSNALLATLTVLGSSVG